MKVYSIGREVGCDIVINDNTDVISRRHATLNVTSSGKMTIIDQSHNGTYVNGIRITQNVPVPVTRKDNVSFAHVARLDWKMVPKPTNPLIFVVIAIVAFIVIAGGGIFCFMHFGSNEGSKPVSEDTVTVKKNDVDEAKAALKTKIVEATGVKSAISNKAALDSLGAAIKSAQETYDNASATKEDVVAATEALQKAIDAAKGKKATTTTEKQNKPKTTGKPTGKKNSEAKSSASQEVKKCNKCGKPLSQCEYKGNHPEQKKSSRSDR